MILIWDIDDGIIPNQDPCNVLVFPDNGKVDRSAVRLGFGLNIRMFCYKKVHQILVPIPSRY
jgi:hypothetical protein